MAESSEISMLDKWLDVALNPIGSLALVERFDENTTSILRTFNIFSPKIVDLILSPYGFRIVESFLTVDEVYVKLAESLSEEWSGLEKVLKTEKGRYVCETLLKKKMNFFAHKIISIAPRDWWFKNVEALTILIKAITFSDVDVAKEFIFQEHMVIDICDAPEGLYCVLKVMSKSKDQTGWKDALSNLVLLKSKSIVGSEALAQAILYGDYLVNEVVEIICGRRESFDNSTVSLIIRLIEQGSASVKELIVKCLCETNGNPVIIQIRNTKRFANFTPSQRKRLDDCMASTRVCSVVDDCVSTLTTIESDSMSVSDGQNKKRRSESQATPQSAAKKPREEDAEHQTSSSKTTVTPVSTVTIPAAIPPVSTVSLPSTITAPSTVTSVTTTETNQSPSTVLPPRTVTTQPTVTPPSTVLPPPTVTIQLAVASTTVPIPTTTPSVKPPICSISPTSPPPLLSVPVVDEDRLQAIQRTDPGKDVISMAMSEKYRSLLSKLAMGTPKFRLTVFNCIRNALLPLIMDERGSEVVKWFIVNGTPNQKEEIERKVEENIEDLATNGGYGRAVVQSAIDNCPNPSKRMHLCEKFMKATKASRPSLSSTPVNGFGNSNEIEISSQKINKQPDERSTVVKPDERTEKSMSIPDRLRRIVREDDNGKVSIVNGRTLTDEEVREIRQIFDEIDRRLRKKPLVNCNPGKIKRCITTGVKQEGVSQLFIDLVQERVATWVKDECGTKLLSGLAQEKVVRRHLVYAVASVLHLLRFQSGIALLTLMLQDSGTRMSFVKHCIARNDDSPLVKLFHSDLDAGHCLWIGKECARENPNGVRALINSSHGRSIEDTVNGGLLSMLHR